MPLRAANRDHVQVMDLRDRAPGHSLIEKLLALWDKGVIRLDPEDSGRVLIDDEAVSWYRGVQGERHIARLLARLGTEYTVLHSVPVGVKGRDIDHLVVGPTGVFTINAKNSAGKRVWAAGFGMRVGNHPQNGYIQSALAENRRVTETLSERVGWEVPVITIVAFVQPERIQIDARVGDGVADIRVLPDDRLVDVITRRRLLSDEQASQLAEISADARTWLPRPQPWQSGEKIALEFDALEEAVREGMRRRLEETRHRVPYTVARSGTVRTAARTRGASTRAPRQVRTYTRPATARSRPASARRRPSASSRLLNGLIDLAVRLGALALFIWFMTNVMPQLMTSALVRSTQP